MAAAPPDHITQQLLDAVVTAVTGLTTTGTNVFANHPEDRALQSTEIPALLVYLGGEEAHRASLDATMMERTTRVYIDIKIKGVGAIDETLTMIRREVETVLAGVLTVDSKSVYVDYVSLTDPEFDSVNDQPMVSARMEFHSTLFNLASTPGVLL